MRHDTQEQALKGMRRITGQALSTERMMDEDRYCADVLLRVADAWAALDGALLQNSAYRRALA